MDLLSVPKNVRAKPAYVGPIFDSDSHILEKNFDFMAQYTPKHLHEKWLVESRYGADGEYALYLGDFKLENTEIADGLAFPPGRLKEWLAAMARGEELNARVPLTPDMYSLKARVAKMDEFGVDGALLFPGLIIPTFGYLYVFGLEANSWEGPNAVLHAYNQHMLEEFSLNYQDRLYPVPILTLWDLDWAVKEAKWLVANGCRAVTLPAGPGLDGHGPADSYHDPLWNVLNEAGVVITYHVGDASFLHGLVRQFGEEPLQNRRKGQSAWQWMYTYSELPVQMTLSAYIYANFFERFPNLKMASVENGAEWLPRFLYKMDKMRGMARAGYWPHGQLKQRPSAIFREHCFAVAYPEDDVASIVAQIGSADSILMGSDYPHPEGVPAPHDFVAEGLGGVSEADAAQIMFSNGRRMMPRR